MFFRYDKMIYYERFDFENRGFNDFVGDDCLWGFDFARDKRD